MNILLVVLLGAISIANAFRLWSQLFCSFETLEEKMRAMANLRYRVLPPQLLLKWPKEASFCQLMMHPVPDTRPKMRFVCVIYIYIVCKVPPKTGLIVSHWAARSSLLHWAARSSLLLLVVTCCPTC